MSSINPSTRLQMGQCYVVAVLELRGPRASISWALGKTSWLSEVTVVRDHSGGTNTSLSKSERCSGQVAGKNSVQEGSGPF